MLQGGRQYVLSAMKGSKSLKCQGKAVSCYEVWLHIDSQFLCSVHNTFDECTTRIICKIIRIYFVL